MNEHTVVKGDTLSEIAEKYYGDKMLYPQLASYNNIKNPNIIHIGDKIKIPKNLGKKQGSSWQGNTAVITIKPVKIIKVDSCTLEITIAEKHSEESCQNIEVKLTGTKTFNKNTDLMGKVEFSNLAAEKYDIKLTQLEVQLSPDKHSIIVKENQKNSIDLRVTRQATSVKMKRKHIDFTGEDKYGHWWTEIDSTESYGWWPAGGVGVTETLGGTKGVLNGEGHFAGGTVTRDPHHGDPADEEFNPFIHSGLSANGIKQCIRSFAKSYSGEWRWSFGLGQNCHTFQEEMMEHCQLEKP